MTFSEVSTWHVSIPTESAAAGLSSTTQMSLKTLYRGAVVTISFGDVISDSIQRHYNVIVNDERT